MQAKFHENWEQEVYKIKGCVTLNEMSTKS